MQGAGLDEQHDGLGSWVGRDGGTGNASAGASVGRYEHRVERSEQLRLTPRESIVMDSCIG